MKTVLVFALSFFMTASAHATISCEVLKTPDGFVALRSGPSAATKLLLKLKPGEMVQVGSGKKGQWEKVIYYLKMKKESDAKPLSGWIKTRFLSDVCG